jgi:hypothetical protein
VILRAGILVLLLSIVSSPLEKFGVLESADVRAHDRPHDHRDGHHHHEAPHGGTLISLGNHVLHLELLLESERGQLVAWILDGEAERGIRTEQTELTLTVLPTGETEPFELTMRAVANALTGETVGDTSEFHGSSEGLVGVASFSGTLDSLTARGVTFRGVDLSYPGDER